MNTVILTPALLESFTARLRCEEKSPFTVEKYVRDVRAFMAFAGERPLSKELVMDIKPNFSQAAMPRAASTPCWPPSTAF